MCSTVLFRLFSVYRRIPLFRSLVRSAVSFSVRFLSLFVRLAPYPYSTMAGNNSGGKRAATRTATAGSGGRASSARSTPDSAGRNVQFQSPPPQTPPTMRTVRINDVDLYVMFLPHTIYGQRWADGWNSSYGITLRTKQPRKFVPSLDPNYNFPLKRNHPSSTWASSRSLMVLIFSRVLMAFISLAPLTSNAS